MSPEVADRLLFHACRDFMNEISEGEWGEELVSRDARRLAEMIKPLMADGGRRLPARLTSDLSDDDVEWVVNDMSELGVKIGGRFFFLYKGESLTYTTGRHDDGSPIRWRRVFKREFGECCRPLNGLVSPDDGSDWNRWRDLPSATREDLGKKMPGVEALGA